MATSQRNSAFCTAFLLFSVTYLLGVSTDLVAAEWSAHSCWNGVSSNTNTNNPHTQCKAPDQTMTLFMSGLPYVLVAAGDQLTVLEITASGMKKINTRNLTVGTELASCHGIIAGSSPPLQRIKAACFKIIVSQMVQRDNSNEVMVCDSGHQKPKCRLFQVPSLYDATPSDWGVLHQDVGFSLVSYGFVVLPLYYSPGRQSYTSIMTRSNGLITAFNSHNEVQIVKINKNGKNPMSLPDNLRSSIEKLKSATTATPIKFYTSFVKDDYFYFIYRVGDPFFQDRDSGFIGRVCLKDNGTAIYGSKVNESHFKNVLVARMNCTVNVKGKDFVFTNLSSVLQVNHSLYNEPMVYAAFRQIQLFPEGEVGVSVICVFNKNPQSTNGSLLNWFSEPHVELFKLDGKNPKTPLYYKTMTQVKCNTTLSLNFGTGSSVNDDSGSGLTTKQITSRDSVFIGFRQLITAMADMTVRINNTVHEFLFAGLSDGRVVKTVFNHRTSSYKEIETGEFADGEITQLKVVNSTLAGNATLYISTASSLVQTPVQHCQDFLTCQKCIEIQDPFCGWSSSLGQCTADVTGDWHQDLEYGNDTSTCPDIVTEVLPPVIDTTLALDETAVLIAWIQASCDENRTCAVLDSVNLQLTVAINGACPTSQSLGGFQPRTQNTTKTSIVAFLGELWLESEICVRLQGVDKTGSVSNWTEKVVRLTSDIDLTRASSAASGSSLAVHTIVLITLCTLLTMFSVACLIMLLKFKRQLQQVAKSRHQPPKELCTQTTECSLPTLTEMYSKDDLLYDNNTDETRYSEKTENVDGLVVQMEPTYAPQLHLTYTAPETLPEYFSPVDIVEDIYDAPEVEALHLQRDRLASLSSC